MGFDTGRHGMETLSLLLARWSVDSRHKMPVMRNIDFLFLLAWTYCWTNIAIAGLFETPCRSGDVTEPWYFCSLRQKIYSGSLSQCLGPFYKVLFNLDNNADKTLRHRFLWI